MMTVDIVTAIALDDRLKDVGSFASLSLALLVLFTNRRADSLDGWQEDARRTDKGRARWDVVLDGALLVATALLLLALLPLVLDAIDELGVGRARGAVRSLFLLVWGGFAILGAFQVWILKDRLRRYKKTHPKSS